MHEANIFDIFSTFFVSNLETSIEVKEVQPSNKLFIFLTLVVVNFDKSIEDNPLHDANIKDISSAF